MQPVMFRNVNDGFFEMVTKIHYQEIGTEQHKSRYGDTLRLKYPVTWGYVMPEECVLMNHVRDANPFFHMYEALWMLAGSDDVHAVAQFCSRMKEFSDDGDTINDAYGYRWRHWFEYDQLLSLRKILKTDPNTRRAVLTMWDATADLEGTRMNMKAVPCNTHCYFAIKDGRLNLTICNRSNDLLWGAFGANAVHFSFLLQYMAMMCGLKTGMMVHFSNDLHLYQEHYNADAWLSGYQGDPYQKHGWIAQPLAVDADDAAIFDEELEYIDDPCYDFDNTWLHNVYSPAMEAWACHKERNYVEALASASEITSPDWKAACIQWLKRREERWECDDK